MAVKIKCVRTVGGGMTGILPKVHKIGDVGGAPNDDIAERSMRVHQQAPDSGCQPGSAAWRYMA